MYEAQQWNAGGGAGSLSLRLCSYTHPISQTGTAGVILLRMDVVIVRLDVHFGFSVCWEHTWAGAAETMGRELFLGGGECLFLALKRWRYSRLTSVSFLGPFCLSLVPNFALQYQQGSKHGQWCLPALVHNFYSGLWIWVSCFHLFYSTEQLHTHFRNVVVHAHMSLIHQDDERINNF